MRVACVVIPHLQARIERIPPGAGPPCECKVFRRVVDGLTAIGDRVEAVPPGVAYVRLDGLAKLYGGETQLLKALHDAVPKDLESRIGVANGKFPAFMAASVSSTDVTVVPADVPGFLAPHTVDWLPVPGEVRDGLHRFGLHAMGSVAALNEGQLVDQFGLDGRRAFRLCRGIDDSPVIPLKREEPVVERLSLPFPTTTLQVLRATIDTLLRRAYAHPRMRGRCPGRADLECTVSDAPPWAHAVHFKETVPGWERAAFIINHQVEGNPPPAPVEVVRLVLSGFTTTMGVQLSLLPTPNADREQRLLEAERCLRFRMQGRHALHRVVAVAPWHPAPERRALQIPIDPAGKDAIKPLSLPAPVAVREGPDRRPLAVRLQRQWRPVARIDDRWAFDLWWQPQPLTRTYYRVNPGDGRQVTVFRNHRDSRWYRQSA